MWKHHDPAERQSLNRDRCRYSGREARPCEIYLLIYHYSKTIQNHKITCPRTWRGLLVAHLPAKFPHRDIIYLGRPDLLYCVSHQHVLHCLFTLTTPFPHSWHIPSDTCLVTHMQIVLQSIDSMPPSYTTPIFLQFLLCSWTYRVISIQTIY